MSTEKLDDEDNTSQDLVTDENVDDVTSETSSVGSSAHSSRSSLESNENAEDIIEEPVIETPKVVVRRGPFDDLPYDDFAKVIEDMQAEKRHLITETNMFIQYLQNNDPDQVQDIDQAIQSAMKMQRGEVVRRSTLAESMSAKSLTSSGKHDQESSISGMAAMIDKGPRINLTQKGEMVTKDIVELQKGFSRFYKDSQKRKCIMLAELEEINLEFEEINESLNNFEKTVVIEGVNPLTKRIPAEKFIRFMQEEIKTCADEIQQFRLKKGTLISQLRKVIDTLKQKKELGESLHAVDFEKLQIENGHFIKEIEMRTQQLIELKRMSGEANLILTNQKKFLMKQMLEMQKLQKGIDDTKTKIDDLERDAEAAEEQLEKVVERYDSIKEITTEYKVPDVMEYIKIKGKVNELKKQIKIWSRRCQLQNVALKSSIRQMKNITGSKKVLSTWFEVCHSHNSSISELETKSNSSAPYEEGSISKKVNSELLFD